MAQTLAEQQPSEVETKEPSEMKEGLAAEKQEEPAAKKENTPGKPEPKEIAEKDKAEQSDKKPTELVNKKADGKSKSELETEELAQKKKFAAAQCDDFSKWVKEKCPSCPPIPRMFLYSIPVFITLPLLYRKFFCPPKCLRVGQCSKIYPGCCEPENRCNKPPCCNQR